MCCNVVCSCILDNSSLILFQSAKQNELVAIQPNFKGGLLDSVELFKVDEHAYTDDYETVSTSSYCLKMLCKGNMKYRLQ